MPARADGAQPSTIALLIVDAIGGAWALPGAAVAGVEPFEPASSEGLIDVPARLGASPVEATDTARVLVLQVSGEHLRLLARGALILKTIDQRELLPLPPTLAERCPLVSHVALVDGRPALLVVSPERLLVSGAPPEPKPASTLLQRTEVRPC